MSVPEDWATYLCFVDEQPASILVDLSFRDSVSKPIYPVLGRLELELRDVGPYGLVSAAESPHLDAIEDTISAVFSEPALVRYVGRITSNGRREYYFYLKNVRTWEAQIAQVMAQHRHYEYTISADDDLYGEEYVSVLFPTPRDLQQINNRKMRLALDEAGDCADAVRQITHYATFKTQEQGNQFADAAVQHGFWVDDCSPEKNADGQWGVVFSHEGPTHLHAVDVVIAKIDPLTEAFQGRYQGWKTVVIRDE